MPRPVAASPRVPRLHVITDAQLQQRFTHLDLAAAAIAGGADLVQLRDKHATDAELEPVARALIGLCRARGVLPLVNDRVQLAARVGAGGVHLGRTDLAPDLARAKLGPTTLIGATANTLAEALALRDAPIDYLGVGPVFGTTSKHQPAATLHLSGLAEICAAVPFPVIAIGGITAQRVAEVLATGAHGVAVLGAVCLVADPVEATAELRAALDAAALAGARG